MLLFRDFIRRLRRTVLFKTVSQHVNYEREHVFKKAMSILSAILSGEIVPAYKRKAFAFRFRFALGYFCLFCFEKLLSEVHRNKIRIGIRLEGEVNYNWVACGTGVLLCFLKDLNLTDKYSEQFGRELLHFNIRLGLFNELSDAHLSHIHLIHLLGDRCKLLIQFRLFGFVAHRHGIIAFHGNSSAHSVLV